MLNQYGEVTPPLEVDHIPDGGNVLRVERPDLHLDELAEGVYGYTMDKPYGFLVPFIVAMPEGQGNVSKYLDSLPRDRTVIFPNVIHPKLAQMLARRGFRYVEETPIECDDEPVDGWMREAEVTDGTL